MTPEQYVQQKAAASGSSFYYAFLFLPKPRRAAITAFYAFCREVDDVVDEVTDPGVAQTKLAWWQAEVARAYAGEPTHPVTQALMPLILDLDLGVDTREAAASDHIRDALDYKAVCDAIERLVRERQFQLLETFAESAARRLFEEFPLLSLRLSVSKPGAVTAARTVGVEIERRREDYAVCGRGGV